MPTSIVRKGHPTAGKCLALNRETAGVFHLMRVLQIGLYALADDLHVQNLRENWQNAIEKDVPTTPIVRYLL